MFAFTCWKCNEKMREAELEFTDEVNGESFTIATNGIVCDKCGYQTVAAPQMDAYNIAFADAYRMKHGLLTTSELIDYRENVLKMSQQAFADYIGVHIQSVKKWEHGCVQKKSSDRLMRKKIDGFLSGSSYAEEVNGGEGKGEFTKFSDVCKYHNSDFYRGFTIQFPIKEPKNVIFATA